LSRKRLALTLFLVLVTLSAVATLALLSIVSLSSEVSVASIGGFSAFNVPASGTIVMGDPKDGDWSTNR
jgi:hypothetical protein